MFSDNIEQLKNQFTDKYVAVDATRAELARFRDLVGQVKTVNMSGRALVEFMDYHLNIGWYDIDLSCLKVVDKPSEEEKAKKTEARKPAEKPAAKAAPAAAAKPAAKPAGGKMSVAEMMAAARANKGTAATPAAKADAKPAAPKASPASAGGSEAAPAKVDRSKMSVAEMLAAARANKTTADAPASEAAAAPAAKPAPKAAPEKPAAPAEPAAEAPAGEPKKIDRSKMSVAEMLAYARKSDSK